MIMRFNYFLIAAMLVGLALVCPASAQDQDTMSPPIIHRINERGSDHF